MIFRLQANAWIESQDLEGAITQLKNHFESLGEGGDYSAIVGGHITLSSQEEKLESSD